VSEELLSDRDYACVADTYGHSHGGAVCSRDNNNINDSILVHSERQFVPCPLHDILPGKYKTCFSDHDCTRESTTVYKI
jgi:hypothetical protein